MINTTKLSFAVRWEVGPHQVSTVEASECVDKQCEGEQNGPNGTYVVCSSSHEVLDYVGCYLGRVPPGCSG